MKWIFIKGPALYAVNLSIGTIFVPINNLCGQKNIGSMRRLSEKRAVVLSLFFTIIKRTVTMIKNGFKIFKKSY